MNHNLLKNLFTALALMAAANLTAALRLQANFWNSNKQGFADLFSQQLV